MRLFRPLVMCAASVLALACSSASDPSVPPVPSTSLPRPLTTAEQSTLSAANEFSFSLFREIAKSGSKDNVFVSPISASMSLGMTMNGARGTTLDAMRSALGVSGSDLATINTGYKGLIDLLRGLDATSTFQIANSIWYRNSFTFSTAFIDTTKKWFDATVQGLNFGDVTGSLAAINGWVNTNTSGTIPTILDAVTPDEVMFLINAIYFKGAWQLKFDPKLTSAQAFHAADGSTQTVQMMARGEHLSPKVRTGFAGRLSALEMPYGNGNFAMDVISPATSGVDIDSIARSLTLSEWNALIATLSDNDPAIVFPKFTLKYERTLNDDLSALGMGIAFTDRADFSGMSPVGLALEFVKQKAFVDVNEDGTVAGASTITGVVPTSFSEVRIDHPFIFVIRERVSGTILFMGKVDRLP
ncbi:MAG: serpin family protein [Gemmatimonadaceae bacterium]